ncbi:amidohydrolase family protein [Thermodesulfobacteriota bacterium]
MIITDKRMTKTVSPGRSAGKRPRKSRRFVIDFHAHMVVPEVFAFSKNHTVKSPLPDNPRLTKKVIEQTRKWGEAARRRMGDFKLRLRDMDKAGVDMQVLTPSLVHQFTYWAAPAASLKMERLTNDRVAEIVASKPDRFIGLGGVPLQSPKLAIRELERCVNELGLKGVQVSNPVRDMELGDPRLRLFWAKAVELGAVIYVHPAGITDKRYEKHQLWNSIGQPLEEAMAMASLFYEGVLDDFPKLKICIGHGGGYLPFYPGRVDRNYMEKPATRLNMSKSPSQYMRMFTYDSCVYDVDMLKFLIKKVGAGRVVMGSDYPVGEKDPVGFVRKARSISAADKEKILWKNAARILGLSL